ncbi:hypothetical protein H4R33_006987, partial [Dimargaris cristalligena]
FLRIDQFDQHTLVDYPLVALHSTGTQTEAIHELTQDVYNAVQSGKLREGRKVALRQTLYELLRYSALRCDQAAVARLKAFYPLNFLVGKQDRAMKVLERLCEFRKDQNPPALDDSPITSDTPNSEPAVLRESWGRAKYTKADIDQMSEDQKWHLIDESVNEMTTALGSSSVPYRVMTLSAKEVLRLEAEHLTYRRRQPSGE